MNTRNRVFGVCVCLTVCLSMAWYCGLIEGNTQTHTVRPEIRLPEYRTDAARAIDAYERLMDRYMTLMEQNLVAMNGDLRGFGGMLGAIDGRLTELSERMGRIEKALGIETAENRVLQGVEGAGTGEDGMTGSPGGGDLSDDAGNG